MVKRLAIGEECYGLPLRSNQLLCIAAAATPQSDNRYRQCLFSRTKQQIADCRLRIAQFIFLVEGVQFLFVAMRLELAAKTRTPAAYSQAVGQKEAARPRPPYPDW